MTVLVLAPHPDDEALGPGGTIARLSSQGERVVVVIFSMGEGSHPWQRQEAIIETRRKEALEASKILGTAETIFFALKDFSLGTEIVEKDVASQLYEVIEREKPRMIFTTAVDDWYPDHRAVANLVIAVHDKHKLQTPIWMYTVWNPLYTKYRNQPRLVVDITKQFRTKWRAIHAHQSQKISTYQLIPTVMLRSFIHGLRHGYQMAEVFLKAR